MYKKWLTDLLISDIIDFFDQNSEIIVKGMVTISKSIFLIDKTKKILLSKYLL